MATVALPRFKAPDFLDRARLQALLRSPYARVTAPAALFSLTLIVLVALMSPAGPGGAGLREPLAGALADAPTDWRKSLRPLQGPAQSTEGALRLSANPLAMGEDEAAHPATSDAMQGQGLALQPAPIAGYFTPGPTGPLPIIAADGGTPFSAYARPFTSNGRPRIGLVISGLGLNAHETRVAIETLPPEITLSFTPYAEDLQGWIDQARAHGHEVLLEAPMEPTDYPQNDPGPYTLMTDAPAPDTVKKVEWILSRATGYLGLANYMGSRFLGSETAYRTLTASLKSRGLGFIDDGAAAGLTGGGAPRASTERTIDAKLNRAGIDQQLLALEASALQHGQALGAGFAYPVTVSAVAKWAADLGARGYQLAPASAFARP